MFIRYKFILFLICALFLFEAPLLASENKIISPDNGQVFTVLKGRTVYFEIKAYAPTLKSPDIISKKTPVGVSIFKPFVKAEPGYIIKAFSWTPDKKSVEPSMYSDTIPGAHKITFELIDADNRSAGTLDKIDLFIRVIIKNIKPEMVELRIADGSLTWRGENIEDKSSIFYSYRIDKGEWSEPDYLRRVSIEKISEGIKEGKYRFWVKAVDSEGLESEPRSLVFTTPGFNNPPDFLYIINVFNLFYTWLAKDDNDGFDLRYRYYNPSTRKWSETKRMFFVSFLKIKKGLRKGNYTFQVLAFDKEGEYSRRISRFKIK